MKWSIHQLRKNRENRVEIDEMIDLSSVIERDESIRAISPVHLTGYYEMKRNRIDFFLRIEGEVTVPCARTWEDAKWPFALDTFEQFSWDEHLLSEDETVIAVEQNIVDAKPILEEILIVSIPLQVYSEDAEDFSIQEGKGWSFSAEDPEEEETVDEPKIDPRLAGLAQLLNKED